MALELQIGVEADSQSMVVYDATCAYSTPENEGGWGAPNSTVNNIISAIVSIWYPSNDTDQADHVIDVYPYLPNPEGTGFRITVEDHLISPIIDGLYRIEYTVTDEDGNEYTANCVPLFTNQVICCLQKRLHKIDIDNCDLEYDKETVRLNSLYDAMLAAYCEGDLCKVNRILRFLLQKCECCC